MEIGTTPTHTFNIPKDIYDKLKEVKITYWQNQNPILEKRTNDCTIEDGKISVRLTQAETFLFDQSQSFVYIQIRVLTTGNDCFKSQVISERIGRCLDTEVLK